jgi:hypothetical protein
MVTTVRLPPLQTMNQMLAFAPHLKTKLPKHQANESSRGAPRSSNRLLWDTFRLRQQFFVGLVGRSLSVSDLRQPFPLCTTTRVVLSELSNRNSICQVQVCGGSSNGSVMIATLTPPSLVRVWDAKEDKLVMKLQEKGAVKSMRLCPRGEWLCTVAQGLLAVHVHLYRLRPADGNRTCKHPLLPALPLVAKRVLVVVPQRPVKGKSKQTPKGTMINDVELLLLRDPAIVSREVAAAFKSSGEMEEAAEVVEAGQEAALASNVVLVLKNVNGEMGIARVPPQEQSCLPSVTRAPIIHPTPAQAAAAARQAAGAGPRARGAAGAGGGLPRIAGLGEITILRPPMVKLFRAQTTGAKFFSTYSHGYGQAFHSAFSAPVDADTACAPTSGLRGSNGYILAGGVHPSSSATARLLGWRVDHASLRLMNDNNAGTNSGSGEGTGLHHPSCVIELRDEELLDACVVHIPSSSSGQTGDELEAVALMLQSGLFIRSWGGSISGDAGPGAKLTKHHFHYLAYRIPGGGTYSSGYVGYCAGRNCLISYWCPSGFNREGVLLEHRRCEPMADARAEPSTVPVAADEPSTVPVAADQAAAPATATAPLVRIDGHAHTLQIFRHEPHYRQHPTPQQVLIKPESQTAEQQQQQQQQQSIQQHHQQAAAPSFRWGLTPAESGSGGTGSKRQKLSSGQSQRSLPEVKWLDELAFEVTHFIRDSDI